MEDPYQILGLKPGASRAELKQAYRDLTKVWHPDRFLHDKKLKAKAEARLQEINAAYEALLLEAPGGHLGEGTAHHSHYVPPKDVLTQIRDRERQEVWKSWVSFMILIVSGLVLGILLYTVDNTIQKAEPRKTVVAIVSS